MKQLLFLLIITSFLAVACTPQVEPIVNSEEKTFTTEGFSGRTVSFKYPADWIDDGYGLFNEEYPQTEGEHNPKVWFYRTDIMGPNCLAHLPGGTYVDAQGRTWKYGIETAGIPEGLEEMCEGVTPSDERRLVVTIYRDESRESYEGKLLYNYYVENETESIEQFKSILDSLTIQ